MQMIRKEHGLTGLRVGYRQAGGEPAAVTCTLERPEQQSRSWELPAETIGLLAGRSHPDESVESDLRPCRDYLASADSFQELKAEGNALWLAVTNDHPLLAAIDWESGLAGLDVPVLRIPSQLGTPTTPPARPRVALWVTMPAAKSRFDATDLVAGALAGMRAAGTADPEVHLFADAELTPRLRAEFGDALLVHDPEQRGPHEPTTASLDRQPWLAWIARALRGECIDVLHLVGHGFLRAGQGAFACAEAPERNFDRSSARFVWPQQLAGLLTWLGAWGAVFTAAQQNFSAPGLRLLATRTAEVRAAATAFHDMAHHGPSTGLDTIYRLLLAHPADPPRSTAGLALTMHPERFGIPPVPRTFQPARSELSQLIGSGADVPAWQVGAQRQIEQWETQLSFPSDSGRVDATRAGLELAKSRLDALLRDFGPDRSRR